MVSVIVWQCECGCVVKAMYDTNGATMVRCPKRSCERTHTVEGRIVQIWAKDGGDFWKLEDAPSLVMPAA